MSQDARDGSSSPEPDFDEDSGIMAEDKSDRASTDEKSPGQRSNENKPATKSNSKDPSRPRRKKARRACFACQRAHLTCGDERPCLRCIKRGLQDQCHDGVRKKAKYLHDAPAEALIPGFAGNYHLNGSHSMQSVPGAASMGPGSMSMSQAGNYYTQNQPSSYPHYSPVNQQGHMPPPMMDNPHLVGDFTSHPNVGSPTHFQQTSSQQVSPVQHMSTSMDQPSSHSFDSSFVDPNDPSLFNFNISDLNFGNHYGALEFGMLGHLSSGALNTPDIDVMHSMAPSNQGSISYEGSLNFQPNFAFNQQFQPWQSVAGADSRQGSTTNLWALQNNGMDAFAVGENPTSLPGMSPHSQSQEFNTGYQSHTVSPEAQFVQPDQSSRNDLLRQSLPQPQRQTRKPAPFPNDVHQPSTKKRRRDTSEIYTSVQAPYPYTQAFHGLTAFLQKRFPSKKVLKIAKALASIRPSFISCNKNLNHDDLIFMEKCFQRMLYEQEDFFGQIGTPSLVCRRTGEIACVNKEFSLVTGWRRDVLLGKEPNLNVNAGSGTASGSQTGSSTRGAATPRTSNNHAEAESSRPQPVFLAELMDEDSVVQFYEDFAELAFGAARSSIIGAQCTLLKYKTKDDPGWRPQDRLGDESTQVKKQSEIKTESLMKGEAGMNALGEKDGKVLCQMSWTVKRDMFDIPMLIVMNFLPVI